ncbi:MAG TPA: cbb3-type cytochrome c oxidase subunit I [Polyangiaceae bacterium]|nr:cbb3-type cytochrome c oxidase subunit I [Polyangiaceae bacterium]
MDLQPIHPEPTSFISKYVFSHDHKVIAKQFLWAGLLFLAFGGTLAMLIRWQWAFPKEPVPLLGNMLFPESGGAVTPANYNVIFTMHGLIMIFFAITPILIGAFGNYCIPLMIGARDMAFPTLNMLSLWTFILSQLLIIASFLVRLGSGAAGWTTYPPLSTNVGTPGMGQTLVVAAIFVTGISTIMGGINYVTTVIRFRAPGMTWMRLPLTVWGLWLTAILNVLFVPVLGSAGLLLILDRTFGTQFFVAGSSAVRGGGDPILFQHLFWIFGHPEVYILILPVWGIVSDTLSFFARKPAYWYKGSVAAMTLVTILSAVVYGHHMYMTGMSPLLGQSFMLLTLAISVPAMILFVNWLMTIWRGSMRLTVPMLFSLGMVFVFGAGGLTGLYLADISLDLYLHDTMFVVGHFHLTMAAASFLGSFAGIYHWFPKMFGRNMNEGLGKAHFWGSVIFITLVFTGQLIVGYSGQQRRLYDPFQYETLQHLRGLNRLTSFFGFCLATSQVFFVINFFRSVFAGTKAEANPWQLPTLEWQIASPPPYHNFDVIPTVVRGPHEFANPAVKKALGRDWLDQTEEFPEEEVSAPEAKLAERAS